MKVVYDGQAFSYQEVGGVSRYFCELFSLLSQSDELSAEIIVKYSNNRHLRDLGSIHALTFFDSYRFKGRNEIIRFLNRRYFRHHFSPGNDSVVVHPTYYHPYFLERIGSIPFVLTIHDMAHERYPDMFSRFDHTSRHKTILAPLAQRIIAVSEHTKKDIVARLGIPESRVDVIPHATTLTCDQPVQPDIAMPNEYLLYVGKRNTYKNFAFLLRAFQILRSERKECMLVCAGGGRFTQHEVGEIEQLRLRDAIFQMEVDDRLLACLYSNAKAFVYPSLYEGFGIPVLEAFGCGCPAILSNSSSLPEVGGDAALYFNPEDVSELVDSLKFILKDKNLAEEMRSKGSERVKQFTWEKTTRMTLATYKRALAQP